MIGMKFSVCDNWDDHPGYLIDGLAWRKALFGGYVTRVSGQKWKVRLNNFPDEPAYTLVVKGREILHFNEWPSQWVK